jgi:hypothetical protein
MDPQETQAHVMHLMATILPIIIIVGLAFLAFIIFLFWRIFTKAGLSGWFSLFIFVYPIGFLIVLCILAFADWKVIPAPTYAYPPQYPPPPPPPSAYTPQV